MRLIKGLGHTSRFWLRAGFKWYRFKVLEISVFLTFLHHLNSLPATNATTTAMKGWRNEVYPMGMYCMAST